MKNQNYESMYYNMGNIEHQHNNSIFNENDAEKYAPYIKQYPLPLDAVLPLFSWVKVFRNHKMHQLLNQISFQELISSNLFQHINEYIYKIKSINLNELVLNSVYL